MYQRLEENRELSTTQQQWVTTVKHECSTCKNNFPTDPTKYIIPRSTQVGGNIPVPPIP
jgi:hypothetical protein